MIYQRMLEEKDFKMNLWDKKAKSYARYGKLNDIQIQSFEKIKQENISFEEKNIVDIGCGSGVWTLHLAKLAKNVLGVDSSNAMLEILKQDALDNKITNIKTLNMDFEAFKKSNKEKFDIAFLSMSPALQNEDDFETFFNLAQDKIYIAWADYRKSDFLDPIFTHFNTEFKGFYKQDFEQYLLKNNIAFKKFIFDEIRIAHRSKEEAIENALWHLNMNGINANKQDLEGFVKGDIKETIKSKMKLIICK